MNDSILLITNKEKSKLGTGFVIDLDEAGVYVITCGHVVNGIENETIVDGKSAIVLDNKYEEGIDLAILYVEGLKAEPLPISATEVISTVEVRGYSELLGDPKLEPISNISAKTDVSIRKSDECKIDALSLSPPEPIQSGYSGSPVICQHSKCVVGVVNIKLGAEKNYAIRSNHIKDIYNDVSFKSRNSSAPLDSIKTRIGLDKYSEVKELFTNKLNDSLKTYSSVPPVWIEPKIHAKEEDRDTSTDAFTKIEPSKLISNPFNTLFRARQKYGLTTLSHFFVSEAWSQEIPSFWLYIDANEIKPHIKELDKYVRRKCKYFGLNKSDIECVVIDEVSSELQDPSKLVDIVFEYFTNIPVFLMLTTSENPLANKNISTPNNIKLRTLYLWSLPRIDIRKLACEFNSDVYGGRENTIVSKIVSDLEALNVPRTPYNCITMLKIYEATLDDSPINRTEMISKVIFLLFNKDEIPKHHECPDVKDVEFLLGYLCENMLKTNSFEFSRESFIRRMKEFCSDNDNNIEVELIFDILSNNNIIISRGENYCFKFYYWILYFAAHRMHYSKEFLDFVFDNMNYSSYPEIIEFYTGIDRRRDDALIKLSDDIFTLREIVRSKCGLPDYLGFYDEIHWSPSDEDIHDLHDKVSKVVSESSLPDIVKDHYADTHYDRTRPHCQSIHSIIEDYSVLRLMKTTKAASKALRNSDFVDRNLRHKLLNEISLSWQEMAKVLVAVAPILAAERKASIEGAGFILADGFFGSDEEIYKQVLLNIPGNIIRWYKDDIFSRKMSTLLYKHKDNSDGNLAKHLAILLIASKRPNEWSSHLEEYISKVDKNSFYLLDLHHALENEYMYGFATNKTLEQMAITYKMTVAKHRKRGGNIGAKSLARVSDRELPTRRNDDD